MKSYIVIISSNNRKTLPFSSFREIETKFDISGDRGQPWNRRPRSCRKRKSSSTSTGIPHRGRRRFIRPRRSTNRRPSVARTFASFLIAAAAVATFQVSLDPLSIPFSIRTEGEGRGKGRRRRRDARVRWTRKRRIEVHSKNDILDNVVAWRKRQRAANVNVQPIGFSSHHIGWLSPFYSNVTHNITGRKWNRSASLVISRVRRSRFRSSKSKARRVTWIRGSADRSCLFIWSKRKRRCDNNIFGWNDGRSGMGNCISNSGRSDLFATRRFFG